MATVCVIWIMSWAFWTSWTRGLTRALTTIHTLDFGRVQVSYYSLFLISSPTRSSLPISLLVREA